MEEKAIKTYEIAFLLQTEEDFQTVLKHLNVYKAEILNEGSLNKIRLAYEIKKLNEAYFGCIQFGLDPSDLEKLSESLKLDNKIVRCLIVSVIKKDVINKPRVLEINNEEIRKVEPEKEVKVGFTPEISNEALKKKLEEILG